MPLSWRPFWEMGLAAQRLVPHTPARPDTRNYLDWLKTVPDEAIEKKNDKKLDPPLSNGEIERIQRWREAPGRVIGSKGARLL